ncbi:hypothetical protein CSC82_12850, partial [Rhodobacteraceae bacterium 4F10]
SLFLHVFGGMQAAKRIRGLCGWPFRTRKEMRDSRMFTFSWPGEGRLIRSRGRLRLDQIAALIQFDLLGSLLTKRGGGPDYSEEHRGVWVLSNAPIEKGCTGNRCSLKT